MELHKRRTHLKTFYIAENVFEEYFSVGIGTGINVRKSDNAWFLYLSEFGNKKKIGQGSVLVWPMLSWEAQSLLYAKCSFSCTTYFCRLFLL